MARIGMLHAALVGHLAPAIRLGEVLVRQGHDVFAWGPLAGRARIESSGARFHLHEPVPARVNVGRGGYAAMLAEAVERHVGELIEELNSNQIELVVHSSQAPWGRVAADFLGLPRIVSNPQFPLPGRLFPPL